MADSSTYTPETIARRYAMAQQLLADPKQPVRHWAQGLDELAKGALGGYQLNKTENLERQSRADANAQVAAALGLPTWAPVKNEPSGFEKVAALFRPQSATPDITAPAPDSAPQMAPGGILAQPSTGNVPASVRFNNPGAQWPGPSADKFGSTGSGVIGGGNKIAQFPDAVSGAAAQFDLLGRKYAGMPLDAAIAKWSGNNNAPQYAAAVSQATGLPANTPITPELLKNPAVAIPLAKAMAKVETGRDFPMSDQQWQQAHAMAFNGAPTPGGAMPPMPNGAPMPANSAPSPQGDLPQASQPIAGTPPGILGSPAPGSPAAAPASAPVAQAAPAGAPAGLAGNPNAGKIAALLTNPWIDAGVKSSVISQISPSYGFQTLPDGTIIRTNPKNGTVEPIYSAPVKPELKETGTDTITGAKSFGVFDPKTQTMRPVTGPSGGPASGQQDSGILAKGVTQIDHSLTGDAYLNQFGPEMQSAVKAYINGDVMPSGNPRKDAIASAAKTVAQKYSQDTGTPVSDALYAAKRKMQTDLSASGNSSMGGILANGKSAFGHLAGAAEDMVNQGNYSSNIPLVGGTGAAAANYVGNVLTPTSDTKAKLGATKNSLGRFGQEATKFYAGSGGGAEERMAALKNHNPETASGLEQAAFLETERRQMLERLDQKEAQIRDTLGDKYLENHPVKDALFKKNLERIDTSIAKLRGEKPTTTAPSASAAPERVEKTINGKSYYSDDGMKWFEK